MPTGWAINVHRVDAKVRKADAKCPHLAPTDASYTIIITIKTVLPRQVLPLNQLKHCKSNRLLQVTLSGFYATRQANNQRHTIIHYRLIDFIVNQIAIMQEVNPILTLVSLLQSYRHLVYPIRFTLCIMSFGNIRWYGSPAAFLLSWNFKFMLLLGQVVISFHTTYWKSISIHIQRWFHIFFDLSDT